MRLHVEVEAEQDLQAAFDWYESERSGLGDEFLLAVEAAFAAVARRPESFAMVESDIRRASLRRFPYGVFYLIHGDSIIVVAVMHAKRNPRLWLKRRRRR